MLADLLGHLAIIAMRGHIIPILKADIMFIWASTLVGWWHLHFLLTVDLLDICLFLLFEIMISNFLQNYLGSTILNQIHDTFTKNSYLTVWSTKSKLVNKFWMQLSIYIGLKKISWTFLQFLIKIKAHLSLSASFNIYATVVDLRFLYMSFYYNYYCYYYLIFLFFLVTENM